MKIALQPEWQLFLEDQVKSGRFASPAEAREAGLARLMVDSEPDVLDEQDVAEIQQSLEQMRRGEVVETADLHANLRQRFLGKSS